jgi:tripartite-type tricarboxylate transporter receptor subunit TctC
MSAAKEWGTHVVLGAVYPSDYDLLKGFEPIGQLPGSPLLIVSRKAVPPTNLDELIAWLKANQDKVTVGTSGVGGASHIAGVFFQNAIGARF